MDLAQYKKAWENQPEEKNKVSALEIYKMTQSKSTSIAKWIFIIGLAEFAFWLVLNLVVSGLNLVEIYEEMNLMKYINIVYYFNILIVVLFLVIFYRNYSAVSTIDDTKTLMKKIIRVRKTVKFYVYYNIITTILVTIVFNIVIANTPGAIEKIMTYQNSDLVLDSSQMFTAYIISQALAIAFIIGFLFLFYYLLYGILLKKLKSNYRELTKLEEIQ